LRKLFFYHVWKPLDGSNASGLTVYLRRTPLSSANAAQLLGLGDSEAATVGYARVSSHHDQSADLARQQEVLETYCAAKGGMRRSSGTLVPR
jgi:hypothetical protein